MFIGWLPFIVSDGVVAIGVDLGVKHRITHPVRVPTVPRSRAVRGETVSSPGLPGGGALVEPDLPASGTAHPDRTAIELRVSHRSRRRPPPWVWATARYVTSTLTGPSGCMAKSLIEKRISSWLANDASVSTLSKIRPELPCSMKSSARIASSLSGDRRTEGSSAPFRARESPRRHRVAARIALWSPAMRRAAERPHGFAGSRPRALQRSIRRPASRRSVGRLRDPSARQERLARNRNHYWQPESLAQRRDLTQHRDRWLGGVAQEYPIRGPTRFDRYRFRRATARRAAWSKNAWIRSNTAAGSMSTRVARPRPWMECITMSLHSESRNSG